MTQKLPFLFLSSVFCLFVSAQAVKPDPGFGNNGTISFYLDPISFENEFPVALAVQQSDKLLVAATAIDGEGYTGRATVRRIFSNGVIDSSFANGELRTGRGRGFNIAGMSVQPDGKIVTLTRTSYHTDDPSDTVWVERYLAEGGVDSSFGTNGAVFYTYPFNYFTASQLILKPDGKIVVRFTARGLLTHNFVVQLTASGGRDARFGTEGAFIPHGLASNIRTMIALPNNQLLASAIYRKKDNTYSSCLVRYTAEGDIDSSFGTNGIVFNNNTILVTGRTVDMTLQTDHKVLVYTEDNGSDVLLRYTANGALDPSFGNGGKTVVGAINPNVDYIATEVRVQVNGSILVSLANSTKLERFFSNGLVDSSFGTNGILVNANLSTVNPVVFLPYQTKLIVSGTTYSGANEQLVGVNVYIPCFDCSSADAASRTLYTKSLAQQGISLYPNPVKSVLTIQELNSNANNQLILTNAAGQVVQRATVKGNTYQWNIERLPPGIYRLTIISATYTPVSLSIMKE